MGFKEFFTRSLNSSTLPNPAQSKLQPIMPLIQSPVMTTSNALAEIDRIKRINNKYALADILTQIDERLWSVIELTAIMIQKSLADVAIERTDVGVPLTNEEENALLEAKAIFKKLRFKRLAYNYSIDLWKYGDAVDRIGIGSKGITELEALPMNLLTAVERRDQIGKPLEWKDSVIRHPQWYAIDEMNTNVQVQERAIRKERIQHISFNPRRVWIKDNQQRWTFGVWSVPPITSLRVLIEWKHNIIKNDMIWRNRMLPRYHWMLDLSMYDPSKYTGTHDQKIASAELAAAAAVQGFNNGIAQLESDQGVTTGLNVKNEVIEPKSSNYSAPNAIIDQLNSLISTPAGVPGALVGGESKGFTSLLQSSSFTALRAEIYADVITEALTDLMKRHVSIVRPGIREEVVDRLYIRNKLILDRDKSENAKIIATLVGTNMFTIDEIRAIWGLDPMTEKQAMSHLEWITAVGKSGKSPAEVTDDALDENIDSPTGDQQSQRQRDRNRTQIGERTGQPND